jgi:3-dehydroquinate dehydratase/shikimate dehydrogenase
LKRLFLFLAKMTPSLCVTVTAPTTAELRKRRDAIRDADLVELRLDSVSDPDVAGALKDRRRAVIVTCRPTWEGGAFAGSEEERKHLLNDALAAGAEYIDIEARAGFDDVIARMRGKRIVLSAHDFDGMPDDLDMRVRSLQSQGTEVVKVAVQTRKLSDCARLLDIASRSRADNLVLIGMGDHGLATRALASRFGSKWTYAGGLSDVGQVTPESLVDEFLFRHVNRSTSLYGVLGSPVSHSVSPAMHNAAFRATNIDAVYLPLPAVDVDDFIEFAQAFDVRGASVTIPYKVALLERVGTASALATRIGAINTIRTTDNGWLGDNSDVSGFLQPLAGRMSLEGRRVALLGAGGAARAVAVALASQRARVTVYARQRQRAVDVAALVDGSVGDWPPNPGGWDLLVNCTPVGMYPAAEDSPLPPEYLRGGTVYDLVYNPQKTRLLRDAEVAGCPTLGGLDMLVGQARQQFEWWTGVCPPVDVMREAAIRKLAQFTGLKAD